MRLVQIARGQERRVGAVEGAKLQLLADAFPSIYDLATVAMAQNQALTSVAEGALRAEMVDYDSIYEGRSEWKILPSFDHPRDPAHCLVSGTGLTHKASAKNRAAMHTKTDAELTDSFRMFQMGIEGGNPADGAIGVQPEWFFKGNGTILKGHNDALTVPAYGDDGGEEPEIAGVYIISPAGEPVRVGLTVANEFSDHVMEKKNYLYLAPSKLRECSIGPELTIGAAAFEDISGSVAVFRSGTTVWSSKIFSGPANMAHSVDNLEHHHFKYRAHCQPGYVHVHFYGADAFSFGAGIALQAGDEMEVWFPDFGRPLHNVLAVETKEEHPVRVRHL